MCLLTQNHFCFSFSASFLLPSLCMCQSRSKPASVPLSDPRHVPLAEPASVSLLDSVSVLPAFSSLSPPGLALPFVSPRCVSVTYSFRSVQVLGGTLTGLEGCWKAVLPLPPSSLSFFSFSNCLFLDFSVHVSFL